MMMVVMAMGQRIHSDFDVTGQPAGLSIQRLGQNAPLLSMFEAAVASAARWIPGQ
jgi:hypothetical protein